MYTVSPEHSTFLIKQQCRQLSRPIMTSHYPWFKHTVRREHNLHTHLLRPPLREGTSGHPTAVHVNHIRTYLCNQRLPLTFHPPGEERTDIMNAAIVQRYRIVRLMAHDVQLHQFSKLVGKQLHISRGASGSPVYTGNIMYYLHSTPLYYNCSTTE